jgi:enolase-phosphatase E1
MIRTLLTDIEGTTTPIRFVHEILFPYARAALPRLLTKRAAEPEIASALHLVRHEAPDRDPLETLLAWMDEDRKAEPLKTLQGIAWRDGYASGALTADLYPDVAPALHRWHASDRQLAVYSSGSEEAQRLIFGHAPSGDLTPLFTGFFDTRVGAKRDPASYAAIADALQATKTTILFLSDVAAELDAAAQAGLRTCQLLRPGDGAVPSDAHPHAIDFDDVERLFA